MTVVKISYLADFTKAYDHVNTVWGAPSMAVEEVVERRVPFTLLLRCKLSVVSQ